MCRFETVPSFNHVSTALALLCLIDTVRNLFSLKVLVHPYLTHIWHNILCERQTNVMQKGSRIPRDRTPCSDGDVNKYAHMQCPF